MKTTDEIFPPKGGCAKCEHRAELNPDFRDKNWDDLPCSRCQFPTFRQDQPDSRTVLLDVNKLTRFSDQAQEKEQFHERPLRDAKKAELLQRILTNIRDETDVKIVQYILEHGTATQAEIGQRLGLRHTTISRRLHALKKQSVS